MAGMPPPIAESGTAIPLSSSLDFQKLVVDLRAQIAHFEQQIYERDDKISRLEVRLLDLLNSNRGLIPRSLHRKSSTHGAKSGDELTHRGLLRTSAQSRWTLSSRLCSWCLVFCSPRVIWVRTPPGPRLCAREKLSALCARRGTLRQSLTSTPIS